MLKAHAERTSADCGSGCDNVIQSRWAYVPPLPAGTESSPRGIPVAALGLFYFTIVGVGLGAGGPLLARRTLVGLGALISAVYLALLIFVIRAVCPLCLGTHLCSLALSATFIAPP